MFLVAGKRVYETFGSFRTIVVHVYSMKNENFQICNKMKVCPLAKHGTSDIGNSVKDI
jgi:hypothetical protein